MKTPTVWVLIYLFSCVRYRYQVLVSSPAWYFFMLLCCERNKLKI
jgi:hypothetical protein